MGIIDQIDVNEIGIKNKFQEEVKRYNMFQNRVLKIEGKQENKDIDVKSYIKYLLKEGSMSEKREMLSCIKSKIVIRKKILNIEQQQKNGANYCSIFLFKNALKITYF